MSPYSCKSIPNIHFLGNVCNSGIYRNYRQYSAVLSGGIDRIPLRFANKTHRKIENTFKHKARRINSLAGDGNAADSGSSSGDTVAMDTSGVKPGASDPHGGNDDLSKVLEILRFNNPSEMTEHTFELVDKSILSNLDSFRIQDISNLLQMSLKNYYSQNLIEALILKLQACNPADLQISTLALLIQNLGRMQPCEFSLSRLEGFLNETCEYLLRVDNLSESHFSSIIYGFQRLHYSNYEFMSRIARRYERDLHNININSLIISFSALIKMNYFNADLILNVYKIISKSISHMTLQTTIQLIGTISKVYEIQRNYTAATEGFAEPSNKEYHFENITQAKLERLHKYHYRLFNYILKNICNNHIEQLNIVQISLILNSMSKLNFKKSAYLSKLINAIPSFSDAPAAEVDKTTPDEADKSAGGKETVRNPKAKTTERNVFEFTTLPACPFNYELTHKKLQATDPTHLILICEAIFALDYYTNYSLNLMFVARDIINPILHELKANNILLFFLSFTNLYFTKYQLQGMKLGGTPKKSVNADQLRMTLKTLDDHDYHNNHNWFKPENLIKADDSANDSLVERLRERLNRLEWKEELVLNCFENLLRHANYIRGSASMLDKFKLAFALVAHDVYVPRYPYYFSLANVAPPGVDAAAGARLPAILPENIVEVLYELYTATRSEVPGDDPEQTEGDESTQDDVGTDLGAIGDAAQTPESESVIRVNGRTLHVNKPVLCFKIDLAVI